MTIDIDHFKAVNDHPGWGHDVGDEVLIEVARRIMESVRTTDLATRPGGEEFVIVMPNTSVSDAKHIAERTRQRMQDVPFIISASPYSTRITVSIGVSSLAPGEDAIALMKNSDRALYEAKDTGRNKVVIAEAEMNW
jgi:two-component system cell cycle response regulator